MVSSGLKVELLLLQAVPGGSGGEAKEDAGMTREEVQEQVTSILTSQVTSKLTAHIVQVSSDHNVWPFNSLISSNDLKNSLSLGASEAGGGAVGGEGAAQEVPEAGRGEGGGQAEDQGQGQHQT